MSEKKQSAQVAELPEGISQEMINKAREKYGEEKVKMADLPKDDDRDNYLTVLVRRPDRQVMNEYSKWIDKSPGKADEVLLNSCLLSHKDTVKADDGLFMAAVDAIAQLIVIRKAIIKNI